MVMGAGVCPGSSRHKAGTYLGQATLSSQGALITTPTLIQTGIV